MRTILLLFLVCSVDPAPCAANTVGSVQDTNTVAFYFGAHPDDWQLFMNPNANYDVQTPSNKVVFVYVTAGDAGLGLGNGGRAQPYYLARENGAKLSVKFEAGTFAALAAGITALDHPSPWDRLHRSWLSRHYFRVEPGVRRAFT